MATDEKIEAAYGSEFEEDGEEGAKPQISAPAQSQEPPTKSLEDDDATTTTATTTAPPTLISIENFDPLKKEPACYLNGLEPNELLVLPLEYFLETSKDEVTVVQMRHDRFESIRKRHVDKVKETRDAIIKQEDKSKQRKSAHRTIDQIRAEFHDTIKSQEKAYLAKLQRRQQKELQQVMLYEVRVTAMQEKKRKEQREAEEKERAEKLRKILERRRMVEEETKAELAEEKRHRHEEEVSKRREAARVFESFKVEAQIKAEERAKEKADHIAREAELIRLNEERVMKTKAIYDEQKYRVEQRERMLIEEEEERSKKLAERRWMLHMAKLKKQANYKDKVARSLAEKNKLVEQLKDATLQRIERKAAMATEQKAKYSRMREHRKERAHKHRQNVKSKFTDRNLDNYAESLKRLAEKDRQFQEQKARIAHMREIKKAVNRIKEDEIRLFREHQQRSDEHDKDLLLAKLHFQEERYQLKEEMKKALVLQRVVASSHAFKKKEEIMTHFQKLMSGGKHTQEELIAEIEDSLQLPHSDLPPTATSKDGKSTTPSATTNKPRSSSATRPHASKIESSLPPSSTKDDKHVAATADNNDGLLTQAYKQPFANNNSDVSVDSMGSLSIQTDKNARLKVGGRRAGSNRKLSPLAGQAPSMDKGKNRTLREPRKASQRRVPPELAYELLEGLRKSQNEELLKLLADEQRAEQQREATLLQTAEDAERLRLETVVFSQERAAASDRIIRMTEAHEKALEERRNQLQGSRPNLIPPVVSK